MFSRNGSGNRFSKTGGCNKLQKTSWATSQTTSKTQSHSSSDKGIFLPSQLKSDSSTKAMLTSLSSPYFHQSSTAVPAKIFTPAPDEPLTAPKKKTMFVDSAFFSPKVHPTWEQQVQLAKKISASLSDASNKQSRGQNMYERRKKRSVKWVHQETAAPSPQGAMESHDMAGGGQSETEESCQSSQTPKNKPLLQLVMNPHGHVYDLKALTKQGWAIDSKGGLSPEICSDLIRDLNSPTGKGAQIFAKRKKKAEKWVVDDTHREHRRPEQPTPAPPAPVVQPVPQASQAGQLARVTLKPTPPAPAAMPPKPAAVQLPPVQLKPVPLQSLCDPVRQPQHPVGGVYAPRIAHGWSSAPPTGSKSFKAVPVSSFSSKHENNQVPVEFLQTAQQMRLSRAMKQSEENKENIDSTIQNIDGDQLSQEDINLKLAEVEFEKTARQLERNQNTRFSVDAFDLFNCQKDENTEADSTTVDANVAMEVNPDIPLLPPAKQTLLHQKAAIDKPSAAIPPPKPPASAKPASIVTTKADFKTPSPARVQRSEEVRSMSAQSAASLLRHTSPPLKHPPTQTEVTQPFDETTGVWGRVSAMRDTFDSARSAKSNAGNTRATSKGPRAPTMAVPNKFHQMPHGYADPETDDIRIKQEQDRDNFTTKSANEVLADVGSTSEGQDGGRGKESRDVCEHQSGEQRADRYEKCAEFEQQNVAQYQDAPQSIYQAKQSRSSASFYRSITDGSTSFSTVNTEPMSIVDTYDQPTSGVGTCDDIMFQCEVGRVETRVDQEALMNSLQSGENFLRSDDLFSRPSSVAVPAVEVQMRHPPVSQHEEEWDTGASRVDKLQNRQSWANYNTAPRGWGNMDAFYRPVTFTQALMSQ